MSGQQQQQQCRQKCSPKQGPLKATMPIESVTKEGSGLRDSLSPDTSPTFGWRSKGDISPVSRSMDNSPVPHYSELLPDHKRESRIGQNNVRTSPKQDMCNKSHKLRRTTSLDSIYLKGLFPRDTTSLLDRDKSSQTDIATSLDSIHRKYDGVEIVDCLLTKFSIRPRRRCCSKESNTDHLNSNTARSPSSKSPNNVVTKSSRSSEEGLNQEIERIILRSESDTQCDRLRQPTPEGRKAPVADLYRVANFPTLMSMPNYSPANIDCFLQENITANVNCFPQDLPLRESLSPIPGHLDTPQSESGEDSQGSSPEQEKALSGSSPRINRFCARSPPDGAERVLSKSVPILKPIPLELSPPRTFFTLTPSSRSAFESLQRGLDVEKTHSDDGQSKQEGENSPLVPEKKDID